MIKSFNIIKTNYNKKTYMRQFTINKYKFVYYIMTEYAPAIAPFSMLKTALEGTKYLYAGTVVLQVDKRTVWLTPCEATQNTEAGTWTFTTASPWFHKQISVTLNGNFTLPFSSIEDVFQLNQDSNGVPVSWNALVEFDTAYAEAVNHVFHHRWGPVTNSLWGEAVHLNVNNVPKVPVGLTISEYNATILANVTDFSFTWLYNLQALFYAGGVLAVNPTDPNALQIESAASSAVELVVYISYNVCDQLVVLGTDMIKKGCHNH